MELAMEFATFCNICFKSEGLRKVDESENLLKILMIVIENKAIINKHEIYLCVNCCEKLESYDQFKELCLRNFIDFRIEYTELKKKLVKYNDPNVEKKLRNFIETKVYGRDDPLKLDVFADTERDVTCTMKLNKNLRENQDEMNDYKHGFQSIMCKTEELGYEGYKLHTENDIENSEDDSKLHVPIEHVKVESFVEDSNETGSSRRNDLSECSESAETTNQGYRHECRVCKKTFVKFSSLKIHTRVHTGEKPYTCTICNKSFTQSNSLKTHQVIHTGEKLYSCTRCKKTYSHLGSLKVHEILHTGEKPHVCNICNKAFTILTRLKKHMLVHTGEKPYTCGRCSKKFRRVQALRRHERVHTGEKPYACSMCDKTFSASGNLKIHERVHTGEKPYTCIICQKSFRSVNNLKSHERVHTGDKPYKCTLCNERFSQLQTYKVHKVTHTGEKPHKCTVCRKTFTQSSSLKEHGRIHTGDKPFSCNICKRSFLHRSHFRFHKQKPCVPQEEIS